MTTLTEFSYIDPEGQKWLVPAGSKVDGASIPRAFWTLIGGPFSGPYRNASVVHDYYCDVKIKPWKQVHRMFYFAMRASETPAAKAKAMYYAVLVAGPRWKEVYYTNHDPRAFPRPGDIDYYKVEAWSGSFDEETAQRDIEKIEDEDPSLEEIEAMAQQVAMDSEPPDKIRLE